MFLNLKERIIILMNLKTFVKINAAAAKHNFKRIKSLLTPRTKLWAVVKSNAYGHGLLNFSKLTDSLGVAGFCVDSVIEGIKLREEKIKKPVLVLGPTLPNLFKEAEKKQIAITISALEQLNSYLKSKYRPDFHLKIDTGMHRQGFFLPELKKAIRQLKTHQLNNSLTGTYTHFASAKDLNYPTFTEQQFADFQKAVKILGRAGYKNLIKHCAATGAVMIDKKYHLDAVRIGIGLYGLWPSRELEMQLGDKIKLKPVLSWHSMISEIKNLKKGDYVGYDLTERMQKPTQAAVIPIGYWHGLDRRLSSIGEVLIKNKRAKILGRVSMDLIVADISGIKCGVRDRVTIIGGAITASELAQKVGTTHYEIVTRINPLIERVVV